MQKLLSFESCVQAMYAASCSCLLLGALFHTQFITIFFVHVEIYCIYTYWVSSIFIESHWKINSFKEISLVVFLISRPFSVSEDKAHDIQIKPSSFINNLILSYIFISTWYRLYNSRKHLESYIIKECCVAVYSLGIPFGWLANLIYGPKSLEVGKTNSWPGIVLEVVRLTSGPWKSWNRPWKSFTSD